ncbi:MAG: CDP-alcohol phosphatidyltransferase family protein [Ilumatobacteraceae bacterium]
MIDAAQSGVSSHRIVTAPNAFTLLRLCCLPLFLVLLYGYDTVAGAGWLLLAIGATDWVDGWLARRFDQVSEFGKVFDPVADRMLFFVSLVGVIAYPIAPAWFFWAVLVREVVVGITMAVATVAFKMQRFDVTYWGKLATFLLMGAVPAFMVGADDAFAGHQFFLVLGYAVGIPGLALSYWTALAYAPTIRDNVRAGRTAARRG